MAGLGRLQWKTLVSQIRKGKLLPIIGDRLNSYALPGHKNLLTHWAADVGYPTSNEKQLRQVAQFVRVLTGSPATANEHYISFSKQHLFDTHYDIGEENNILPNNTFIDLDKVRLSDLARKLGRDSVDPSRKETPLSILAGLDLPIFITTSFFNFLEKALEDVGKKPRTEICYWRDGLKPTRKPHLNSDWKPELRRLLHDSFNLAELQILCFDLMIDFEDLAGTTRNYKTTELISYCIRTNRLMELLERAWKERPGTEWDGFMAAVGLAGQGTISEGPPSVFDLDRTYEPSIDEPLVFHLYGIDSYPATLVLTEDDHFDFLMSNPGMNPEVTHRSISGAVSESSLLMLGYDLKEWEFKFLFHGLITGQKRKVEKFNVYIQLDPQGKEKVAELYTQEAQDYLKRYFGMINFTIHWDRTEHFLVDLRARLRSDR